AEERLVRAPLQPLAAAVQVDLPADELARQAHVLPAAPDRQRKPVLIPDRRAAPPRRAADHLGHPRRRQRATREDLRVRMPRDDIDPLAPELVHHGLHPGALQANARPDRIDRLVPGRDGYLGPATDLARDPLDLDDPLVDLRDLELEERRHEHRVGPRQDQPRPLRRLLDALQHRADRLALTEPLTRVLLLPRDDGVGLAGLVQHDHDLAALHLLNLAAQQLPDLPGELLADPVALALADALDDPLLRRHHGVPAELVESDGDFQDVADLELGVVPPRRLQGDLPRGILHLG